MFAIDCIWKRTEVSERSKLWDLIVWYSVVMILHEKFSQVIFVKTQRCNALESFLAKERTKIPEAQ
jgi:hypothetical protein